MTAREFYQEKLVEVAMDIDVTNEKEFTLKMMVEFAKMHRREILKSAEQNATVSWSGEIEAEAYKDEVWVDGESILNSYPEDNIK